MTGKYTPGPWVAEMQENGDWFIVADGNEVISVMQQWSPAVDKADAQLIAAAPDLLEVLKEAEQWVADYIIQMHSYTVADDARDTLAKIVQTIAKAEGRA